MKKQDYIKAVLDGISWVFAGVAFVAAFFPWELGELTRWKAQFLVSVAILFAIWSKD